jgi:hypothetical protein
MGGGGGGLTSKKVTFFKGSNWGSKYFIFIFQNKGVLGTHKRGCAKFAPFWMKKNVLSTPRKSGKRAKNHIFKGSK